MAFAPVIGSATPFGGRRDGARLGGHRMLLWIGGGAAAVILGVVAATHAGPLAHALGRLFRADPAWALAGLGFEVASFGGYVLLLWLVAGRATRRFGLRASGQVTLAGTAATRLLPTAGAGGIALTVWALRRAGHGGRDAARTLLTFLVILYSVFVAAVLFAGLDVLSGGAGVKAPRALVAAPVAVATIVLVAAVAAAVRPPARPAADAGGLGARLRGAGALLGEAVRDALRLVSHGDPRLLGALAWWGLDIGVLWSVFHALGTPPPLELLVLGYFVGQLCNLLPLPGTVSGGMVGVLLAFGVEPGLALASVLAYRAIAVWTPAPTGAAALAGLRRTVARWRHEDGEPAAADAGDPLERALALDSVEPVRRGPLVAAA